MFSQIHVRTVDQNSQRFLWRDGNPDAPIRTYVMRSMIFGAACSPCCAEYIKNINAKRFQETMPRGAAATINSMYVDDFVMSFENVKEAEEVSRETIAINAAAGFNLRNFVSNNKTLQFGLCNDDKTGKDVISMESNPAVDKILGMYWNTLSDTFEFHTRFHKIDPNVLNRKRPPTKRELLGIVMAIYDPFGFLADVTICMKILLQHLWKRQTDWDDPLPPQFVTQWMTWWEGFNTISKFAIPRCYSLILPSSDEIQLHVFVDASSTAYAAVAYFRISKGSVTEIAFVASKARCAPLKAITVPRLELQAAVLGSRLANSIKENHTCKISRIVFWSDSKTVILWLRSKTREYKQFVANRVAEILASTQPAQWRWLPTSLNVANDATRANPRPVVDSCSRWIQGPQFLYQEEADWPQETTTLTSPHCVVEESKKYTLIIDTSGEYILNFKNFSSYLRILRVCSWVLRFIDNTSRRGPHSGELKASEIQRAEKVICCRVQLENFADELEELRIRNKLPKSSKLHQLSPFLDEDGLMKVNGRIDAAYCLPVSARRPIIMPQHHYVTRLIVLQWHNKLHHQNDHLTINEIRQKFWVPHIRSVLKSVKRNCGICIADGAKPTTPMMGQLPADRLTPYVRPFTYTGVDYCGPFFVAIGRRREKRWIALFTCLTIRAIHLEIAEDLSTDAFIICLRNFVNRRGVPVRIRSDNGTNFIGAQKLLRAEERLWDFGRIEQECSQREIEWLFNCPANPSEGGCWERLVLCVKRLLQRVLKEEAPRLETLRSTLIEAENIINSRPLTDIPISPLDDEPLTPNHFLLGCLNSTQTPGIEEEKLCLRKQWRIAQALKDRLWKRWTCEYLPSLLRRSKWRERTKPLELDQIVIVCDPNVSRKLWMKGRVVEIIKARDGQVRSAVVQTKQGMLRRPVTKLAALESCESL